MAHAFLVEPYPIVAAFADGSAAGTEPQAINDDMIGVVHRGVTAPLGWVEVDLGDVRSVDFASFLSTEGQAASQRVRGASSRAGLTVSPGFDSGLVNFSAGRSGAFGAVHSWWRADDTQPYRWWRFDFSGLSQPFAAGRLVIGRRLAFKRNFNFGMAPGIRDLGRASITTFGTLDRRIGARLRTLEIAWSNISQMDVQESLMPVLERLGQTGSVLVVTDPLEDQNLARRMFWGFLDEDIEIPQRHYDRWEWRTRLLSMI
ncbi:hypothetical protein JCM17846_18600 [Iodidimonas nitroreducens]|uniref:Uncharacterized protein n=1 Tax=Iodidimonas nitroreducens TaxID=1236968 RepID=A0A5A7N7W5_9PROT|nr:hypothetical protein [Iodidimonas nitroreducens]GAK33243.1 hypothetical protein AQ1_01130 [alpha proteobacterium Q-1]GER04178.1 hypothetical protein JCM17846_18600 [Iodidimonas nitroreducens]